MNAPRAHILLLLLIVCWLPTETFPGERPIVSAPELASLEEPSPEAGIDTQLRINLTTLLEGKTDKDRIDAAGLLLFSDKPAARGLVLDVLRRTDNRQARAAVCEALNPTRIWQKPLKNMEDFIKPLLAILTSEENVEIAKRAAEALLIFGYSQVQADLEKAVTDPSLSSNVRVNVVYALRRHPDRAAVAKLISLLESTDAPVVEAARAALVSIGIPVGPDPAARQAFLAEVRARGAEAFLRERLIRQETRVRELETDLAAGQKRYLTALSDLHDAQANDAAKTAFLDRQLKSPEIIVRSWALDKLIELRNAKGALKLSDLESTLSLLISDPSRQVRLKTAQVLALVGELNTSKPLLEQLRIETDEQVRRQTLVALGEACYTGSVATVGRKVPDEVRRETLEWAVKFLNEPDAEKARSGAGVIGKLLEQDGLKPEDIGRYLKALSDRYALAGAGGDPALRGYLLGAMAAVCATRSTCREQAVKLYDGLFEQALTDKVELVRLNAMDGCVNVDKAGALPKLRENLAADASVAIRQKLMDLVGELGGPQDLDWLAEKVGVAGEGEPAWPAMLKIFKRSDTTVLSGWVAKIEALATAGKVVAEQRIAFLTLVEQAAKRENRGGVLKDAQMSLAQLYKASNNLKQASEYLNTLLDLAATDEERQRVQAQLLPLYLGLSSMDQASDLISKCLSAKDLDLSPNGFVVRSIEEYLNSPTTTDPSALLGALVKIQPKDPEAARAWRALLGQWSKRYAEARKIEGSEGPNN